MEKREYIVIDGDTPSYIQGEMNKAADAGYRFISTVGTMVIMERETDEAVSPTAKVPG